MISLNNRPPLTRFGLVPRLMIGCELTFTVKVCDCVQKPPTGFAQFRALAGTLAVMVAVRVCGPVVSKAVFRETVPFTVDRACCGLTATAALSLVSVTLSGVGLVVTMIGRLGAGAPIVKFRVVLPFGPVVQATLLPHVMPMLP